MRTSTNHVAFVAGSDAGSVDSFKSPIPQTSLEMQQYLIDLFCGEGLSAHAHLEAIFTPDFSWYQNGRQMRLAEFQEWVGDFRQYWSAQIHKVEAFFVSGQHLSCYYTTTQTLPAMSREMGQTWVIRLQCMIMLEFDETTGRCRRWLAVQRELNDEEEFSRPVEWSS